MKIGNLFVRLGIVSLILNLFLISSGNPQDESPSVPADPEIREFVQLLNGLRKRIGCPELKWDDRIAAVAQKHSRDMVRQNFFDHKNPNGKNPFHRLKDANIKYSAAAESIAFGPETGREVFLSWLKSSDHRKNMLNCQYTRHGVGRVQGLWTHDLIRP